MMRLSYNAQLLPTYPLGTLSRRISSIPLPNLENPNKRSNQQVVPLYMPYYGLMGKILGPLATRDPDSLLQPT